MFKKINWTSVLLGSVAVIIGVIVLASLYVGPGRIGKMPPPPAISEMQVKKPNVTLVLDFGTAGEVITVDTAASTPYEALKLVAHVKGLEVKEKNYDFGTMVESIRDVANTPEKAWIYHVNGVGGMVAADKQTLKEGDSVEWRYMEPSK